MRTRIVIFILLLSVSTLWGVPRTGNKEQLQRLVRLPRVEFAPAIDFDRTVGFLVYPEASAIAAKAPELSREAKTPEEAEKSLEAGRLYEIARNHPQALREYSRALNLLRRKVELYPENAEALL